MAKPDKDFLVTLGVYGAIGFQLAISVVVGVMVGRWLDARWGLTPWLTIVGMLLGSGAGFWNLFRLLKWKEKGDDA